jgi:hypothetical protein
MSVSAIRMRSRNGTTFSHRKRARRFWSAMSVALRETGCRPAEAFSEDRDERAVRGPSYDASWRLPAAA